MALRPTGVSTRTLWVIVIGMTVVGVVILLVMGYVWRTGKVAGVRPGVSPEAGATVAYAGVFPTAGSAPLVNPRSISHDGSRLYVTEPDAARVSVYSLDGTFVRALDVVAPGGAYPIDAVALGETLYVADATGRRLLAMPVNGGDARQVAPGIEQPTALAVDGSSLIVADAATGLWRLDGEASDPVRIASEQATAGFTGGIALLGNRWLLTDSGGSRVLEAPLEGGEIRTFGERVNLPRGIAVDAADRVWVADVFGGTVVVLEADGGRLGDIETDEIAGSTAVEIGTPQGVAFEPSSNRLYVVDSTAGRIIVFTVKD